VTATAAIAAPCAKLEQGSDLALLVAFDESEAQRRYAVRTKYNRQRQLLQFARSCPLLAATTRDLVTWLDALRAGRPWTYPSRLTSPNSADLFTSV
jgi:hypothetical protein